MVENGETTTQADHLDDLLRRCVGCGLCLPHCATWAATGNEVHSPRGRLILLDILLQDASESNQADFAQAFDLCIGCRACEAACPSGVPFSLLEHGRDLTSAFASPSTPKLPPVISSVIRHLDSPVLLKVMRNAGKAGRSALTATWGQKWRSRLDKGALGTNKLTRLLGTLPATPENDQDLLAQLDLLAGVNSIGPGQIITLPERQREILFFCGCANEGLLPGTSRRLISLLNACGCKVHFAPQQQCCGALADHTGQPGKAALLKRKNLQAFQEFSILPNEAHGLPKVLTELPIVVEAAGCGLHLKDYDHKTQNRVLDALVLLDSLQLPVLGSVPLKVVYHDPCHAWHGQGIYAEPRRLLKQIPGLVLLENQEAEMCCGSGGAWGLNHPEMSEQLGRRKARHLAQTGADLVLTANPGCLGQISDGLALEAPDLPILPLTDLLWFAFHQRS